MRWALGAACGIAALALLLHAPGHAPAPVTPERTNSHPSTRAPIAAGTMNRPEPSATATGAARDGNVDQPQWSAGNQDDADVLAIADGQLRVFKNVNFLRMELVDGDGVEHGLGAPVSDWNSGDWHQIAASWNGHAAALFVDGALVREIAL